MIIGRGGSKIAEIQQRTQTRVDVNSRERDERGMCLVTISGSEDQCKEAEEIVMGIVNEEDRDRGDRGDRGVPTERGSMDIWVDTSCLGRIIGKGGIKIREIERNYHVKIDVKKEEVEENETKVVLIGAKEDVLATRDHIYDIVDEEL